jgi:hypothetical protein
VAPGHKKYEQSDANLRLIAALAAGLAIFLIATPLILLAAYPGTRTAEGVSGDLPLPPAPRLQVDPRRDLDRLHAEEHKLLTTYGWADGARAAVRIPIDRAMELTAQRGISGWSEHAPDPTIPPLVPDQK